MKNLILLHGALGSKVQFEPLLPYLMPFYEIHTLNFEGHGGLSSENDFTIDLFSNNLLAYLDQHNIQQANIFGYSMGGYVALNVASKHPQRIQQIMTLATKMTWSPEIASQEIKMLNPDKIEEKIPKFAQMLKERHAPEDWKVNMLKTAHSMQDLGNEAALTLDDFSKISHQILIGIGTKDRMVTLEESQKVGQALPNAQLWQAEGFKHPFEQIDYKVLAEQIIAFF